MMRVMDLKLGPGNRMRRGFGLFFFSFASFLSVPQRLFLSASLAGNAFPGVFMKRRTFLGTSAPSLTSGKAAAIPGDSLLAGMSLKQLRECFRHDLFERYIPFFLKNMVDRETGAFSPTPNWTVVPVRRKAAPHGGLDGASGQSHSCTTTLKKNRNIWISVGARRTFS